MIFLYRGTSYKNHLRNNGKLIPKGITCKYPILYGDPIAKYGSGVTYGCSLSNAVIGHQTNSDRYPTSGVSVNGNIKMYLLWSLGIRGHNTNFLTRMDEKATIHPCHA